MIGFSSVSIDPDGYKSGKLNLVYEKWSNPKG
jgi:PP-loop superfamily ATP-utilizing enzyme